MKYIDNFKLFERKMTIDFPDHLIKQFEDMVNEYFENKSLKNKKVIINSLVQMFIDYVLDAYFYPTGQSEPPLTMETILQSDDPNDIIDILSLKNFRDVILKDNKQLVPIFLGYIIHDKFDDDYEKYKSYIDKSFPSGLHFQKR